MTIGFNDQAGFLQIRVNDDQVQHLIQSVLSPAAIKRVQRRAINETSAWVKSRVLRELPAALEIPRKLLSKRIKVTKAKASAGNAISGLVWLGLKPVDAMQFKDKGPSGTGYQTGKYFFEGGFKAFYKSHPGHTGIFSRVSSKRLAIKRLNVPIDTVGNQIVRRLIPQAEQALAQKTSRLVSYELERAAS
jgi:hypothetical protein